VKTPFNRRRFLRGIAGSCVLLPALDAFQSSARAATPKRIVSAFIQNANGFVQGMAQDPADWFWPSKLGTLTAASLAADEDRALSQLSRHASQLLVVRGVEYGFALQGCCHAEAGSQSLSATEPSPKSHESKATGESLDNLIARSLDPNQAEPLTLYAGRKAGYINENLSFRGPGQVRAAENDPWKVYQRMMSSAPPSNDDGAQLAALIARRRKSVNDLVRDELKALQSSATLSSDDRQRLQQHFDGIRDLEVDMMNGGFMAVSCQLDSQAEAQLKTLSSVATDNDRMVDVVRLQLRLMGLGLACGYAVTGTLQIGDGTDGTRYTIDGAQLPSHHHLSHRINGDGGEGTPIPDAAVLHAKIDKMYAGIFAEFVDQIKSFKTPTGSLLDDSALVWTNHIANGAHQYENIPYVIAGSAGGKLKNGLFVDLKNGRNHRRVLTTLATAIGVTTAGGDPITTFGDSRLNGDVLSELLA